MRNPNRFFINPLIITLVMPMLIVTTGISNSFEIETRAQQTTSALERGYRTGYSDGYQTGYRDSIERNARDYKKREDYQRADRAYVAAYGSLEDYRDGYQQGFEIGYEAGFERRGFDSTVPSGLNRRGAQNSQADDGNSPVSSTSRINIPANTVMRVELLTNLSTEASQRGDRFQARVVEPVEYEGAMIDGRVTRVKRPGKLKGTAELQLSFEQIRLTDNRWTDFSAQVVEVIRTNDEGVGDVDPEGGVKGKDSTKDDVVKVGAGSAIGAIIGAIAGGGKGAAIGAVIGGAVGTGGVLASRGKEIRLPRGQQLRIRTSSEAQF